MEITYPRYMMATMAIHQLGDISSPVPDICIIHSEDEQNYIGNWVTGLGFIDVRFPKKTTRNLTPDEVNHYNGQRIAMYGCHTGTPSDISWILQINQ